MKQKNIFITGATAGFGEAAARKFAANGCRLILTGRRKDRLEQLRNSLEDQYQTPVYLLNFDIRDRQACQTAISGLPPDWQDIDVLVNNAGLALGRDNFDQASLDDWDTMIDTNLKGLAYISHMVVQGMRERRSGHIINISSISGKEVYAQGNMYCATKHAVTALSEGMRIDLLPYNIKVTAIHPGAADTEFSRVRFKGNQQAADAVYTGMEPLVAVDVAETIYYVTTLADHVCINELVVTCTQQANSYYSFRKPSEPPADQS
ncbi:SDR family NAD(P)-dependent oxidoreductase [Niabella terrae]